MSNKYNQKILIGAMTVGILGALSSLIRSKKRYRGWNEQAKDIVNHALEAKEMVNKNLMIGGVAGGLVGVITALLLAPKAGKDLLHDIYHPFSHHKRKAHLASRTKKRVLKARPKHSAARSHHPLTAHSKQSKQAKATFSRKKSPSAHSIAHKIVDSTKKVAAEARKH